MMEQKKRLNWLWALFYFIPFVFLGTLVDCLKGTMTGYWIALGGMMILFVISMFTKKSLIALIGNVVSAAISYGLSLVFLKAEEWSHYTKPFTPQSLIIGIAILLLIVQIALWVMVKKVKKNKEKKHEEKAAA